MNPLPALAESSPPLGSPLTASQNSMSPQEPPSSKRRTIAVEATFGQMRPTNDSLSLLGRSKSPCFGRCSQSRARSVFLTECGYHHQRGVSGIDSQSTVDYEEKEEREERE